MAEAKREWMIGHQGADGLATLDEVVRLIKGGQLRETEYVKRGAEPWRAAIEVPELQAHFASRSAARSGTRRIPAPTESKKSPTGQVPKVTAPAPKPATAASAAPKGASKTSKLAAALAAMRSQAKPAGKPATQKIQKVERPPTEKIAKVVAPPEETVAEEEAPKPPPRPLPKPAPPPPPPKQEESRSAQTSGATQNEFQPTLMPAAALPKPEPEAVDVEAEPVEDEATVDGEPKAEDRGPKPTEPATEEKAEDVTAEDALSQAQEASGMWPAIPKVIEGSSVEDEEVARELHRELKAALSEGRKKDALEYVSELLEKYGHTLHVKDRTKMFDAVRRTLVVGGVEHAPEAKEEAEEKATETPKAEKPAEKPKPRSAARLAPKPPPPPPVDPLPQRYYSPADLLKNAAHAFSPGKLAAVFACLLPFLAVAALSQFIHGKLRLESVEAVVWVGRIFDGFQALVVSYGALLAVIVATFITRRQLESEPASVGLLIRHVTRGAVGWIGAPILLSVLYVVLRGVLNLLKWAAGKSEGIEGALNVLLIVPFVVAAVLVVVVAGFWIVMTYVMAAFAVESSTLSGAAKFARSATRDHGGRVALHVFIILLATVGAMELCAKLFGWVNEYWPLRATGFARVLYEPVFLGLTAMLPVAIAATLTTLSYVALRHPEASNVPDGGEPDATEPGADEGSEPEAPKNEADITNPSATQPGPTAPEPPVDESIPESPEAQAR
jgi:hypothetical protein